MSHSLSRKVTLSALHADAKPRNTHTGILASNYAVIRTVPCSDCLKAINNSDLYSGQDIADLLKSLFVKDPDFPSVQFNKLISFKFR